MYINVHTTKASILPLPRMLR